MTVTDIERGRIYRKDKEFFMSGLKDAFQDEAARRGFDAGHLASHVSFGGMTARPEKPVQEPRKEAAPAVPEGRPMVPT